VKEWDEECFKIFACWYQYTEPVLHDPTIFIIHLYCTFKEVLWEYPPLSVIVVGMTE
jgi:hypothetical protein